MHQQHRRQLEQRQRTEIRRRFSPINVMARSSSSRSSQVSKSAGYPRATKPAAREFFAQRLQQFRQMLAQYDGRGADADVPRLSALQFVRNFFEVRKKRPDELVKFFTSGVSANGRR